LVFEKEKKKIKKKKKKERIKTSYLDNNYNMF